MLMQALWEANFTKVSKCAPVSGLKIFSRRKGQHLMEPAIMSQFHAAWSLPCWSALLPSSPSVAAGGYGSTLPFSLSCMEHLSLVFLSHHNKVEVIGWLLT